MRLLIIFMILFSGAAQAIPVTWTLQDVVFDDGGSASGFFIYDADLDLYSSVNITTTSGSDLSGESYLYPKGVFAGPFSLVATAQDVPDLTGVASIALFYNPGVLTNSGGTRSLVEGSSRESFCADPDCNIGVGEPNSRDIIAGSISAVPVPAAVWLFGSALAGLGWLRRKQIV